MSGAARPRPRVAIVVVNYRTAQITCECLDAVAKYVAAGTCEVIVVDNASGDGSAETIRCRHPQAVLIEEARNLGFGEGNNRGVAVATAPYVVLLNSDAILGMDTPNRLVDHLAAHPEVGCVGPRVNLPDGTRQPRIRGNRPSPRRAILQSLGLSRLSPLWHGLDGIDCEGPAEPIAPVGWISGVCMAMRTSDYRAIGGFDAAFFMYCEDIDLCLRMQQHRGEIVHVDDWPLVHLGGASSRPIAKRLRNAVWQQR
ncbi:MAG TPA: glycosyltransferase family 2 protein, partial [Burkholderiaceae bacterium]